MIESDIATGRCTWLITEALRKGTPSQRDVLIKNYGVPKEEAVENVKAVFEQVGIHEMHHKVVNDMFESIREKSKSISHQRTQEGVLNFLSEAEIKFK